MTELIKENLVCIVCPMGCLLEVETRLENGRKKVLSVSHNECKRGEVYAEKELVEPVRTLTTTIAVQGGSEVLLPVKTDGEIPKALLFQSMEILKRIRVKAPIKMGDLVFADILGTGVDVVACKNI